MAPTIQKAASATILSFLGSSFIMGIAIFLMKDTIDRVNTTVDNVNKNNSAVVRLNASIEGLNSKLDRLDTTSSNTQKSLGEYIKAQTTGMTNMSVNIVRVTEKLISITRRCENNEEEIKDCDEKVRNNGNRP